MYIPRAMYTTFFACGIKMTSKVTVCSQFPDPIFYSPSQAIANEITPATTIEEFQEACKKNPSFSIKEGGAHGSHILGCAAWMGNFKVVEHILTTLGKETLNTGNNFGHTPLFLACDSINHNLDKNAEAPSLVYRTVEVLLRHGADPNIASAHPRRNGGIPAQATPLWVAVEKTKNIQVIQLLLSYGAELGSCPLERASERLLGRAQGELKQYRRELCAPVAEQLLPPLAAIVADYAGPSGCLTQTKL